MRSDDDGRTSPGQPLGVPGVPRYDEESGEAVDATATTGTNFRSFETADDDEDVRLYLAHDLVHGISIHFSGTCYVPPPPVRSV